MVEYSFPFAAQWRKYSQALQRDKYEIAIHLTVFKMKEC